MNKDKFINLLLSIITAAAVCVAVSFISAFLTYLSERLNSSIKPIVAIILFSYIVYQLYKLMDKEEGGEE